MGVYNFKKFLESRSDVQEYVDHILDKMLDGKKLSENESKFLKSFKEDNQDEYFDTFKQKIDTERILDNVKDGEQFYITLYSDRFPGIRSTKEVGKINDDVYQMHSTVDGWQTASLNKDELIKFMVGEIDSLDLDWK